jgi:iron complex outermembrane receptor protein
MLLPGLWWTSTVSLLRAEFRDGRDEPGIPSWQFYQELAYRHRSGLFAAIEASLVDSYVVNDANTAHSRGYEVGAIRAGYEQVVANWTIAPFVGLTNLSDANYDGRTRLNAQGGRFFEPAPGFGAYGGVSVSAQL